MRKQLLWTIPIALLLLVFIGWEISQSRSARLDIPVPILRQDGTVGVGSASKSHPSLLAFVLRKTRETAGGPIYVRDYRGLTEQKAVKVQQPDDLAIFTCPQGTGVRVEQMTRRPYGPHASGFNGYEWAYQYERLPSGQPGDGSIEAAKVKAGDPNPFTLGNFVGDAGPQYPFVQKNKLLEAGLIFFAGEVTPGQQELTIDCEYVAQCGNAFLDVGEGCDDGCFAGWSTCDVSPLNDGDGCSTSCQPTKQCNDGVDNEGDGLVDCADPGCRTGDTLSNPCDPTDDSETNAAACGNGVTDLGEQCDDGNASETDACLNGCIANVCGDGHQKITGGSPEGCDDGRTRLNPVSNRYEWCNDPGDPTCLVQGNDGCDASCAEEVGFVCTAKADPTGNPDNPLEPKRSECEFVTPGGPG